MKKKLTVIFLCVALLAIAIVGATLAYFTDTKSATNTFTVGNVKIDLLESSLHRENAGVANGATSDSELWSDVAKEGTGNTSKYKAGDTFYTDAQIEANAAKAALASAKPSAWIASACTRTLTVMVPSSDTRIAPLSMAFWMFALVASSAIPM